MTRPHSDDDPGLTDTADVPPPRRSDEAFARAVAADIDAKNAARTRWPWLALGPLAATAAALAFTFTAVDTPVAPVAAANVVRVDHIDSSVDPGEGDDESDDLDVADLDDALVNADDGTLLALADPAHDDAEIMGDDFSFSGLLGSSDQELAAVEAALDTALRRL